MRRFFYFFVRTIRLYSKEIELKFTNNANSLSDTFR